ncbi:MAG: D-2-hydroxyacid dehydrogenase [Actinomycetota bacterium]|nr:D-2-hydroxyacid dehydrogenase [Actinomycetota bacterium]
MTEGRRPVVAVIGPAAGDVPPELDGLTGSAELRCASNRHELEVAIADAEVVLIWDFRSALLEEVWHRAPRVRWVHVAGAGVDAALFPELVESEVQVTNARGVFDRSIAEFAVAAMLIFAKDLLTTVGLQRSHRWRHRETEMLRGRSALIVGTGGIGREIARLSRCLGVEVRGVARSGRRDDVFGTVHPMLDLHRVLPAADFVVVALPLTRETEGVFGAEEFRRMKSTARFINVGRGRLVDEWALVAALRSGEIAGAALDVFHQEPLPADHPLWDMPQVLVSPHMSGDFVGWLDALAAQFADNLERFRVGEPLRNVVDKGRGYRRGESKEGPTPS